MRLMSLQNGKSVCLNAEERFVRECDVLVIGLGTAGAELAILAAQQGLCVIGTEKGIAPCGQGGPGGVWDYYFGTPGGAWEERDRIEQERAKEGYAHRGVVRSLVTEEALLERGVSALYETAAVGLWMEGKTVCGVRVVSRGCVQDIRARITADCTGNGLVVRMAGGGYTFGRAWDGAQMAYSKVIVHAEERCPIQSRYNFCGRMSCPDEETFTENVLHAATLAPCAWERGAGRVFMEAPMLAQREEGNIIPEEGVTFEEALRGKRTEKPIFYTFTTQDLSNVDRDYAFEDDALQNWMSICTLDRYGYSAAIPFGAMIPRGIDNLLAVGKHLGVDHDLAGGLRMKRDLKKLAEAAAYSCALAVRDNVPVGCVDYGSLSAMLRESGCLDERVDIGIGDLRIDTDCPDQRVSLPETAEAFYACLAKDIPFYGWSMPLSLAKREKNSPALALLSAWLLKDQPHGAIADALFEGISTCDAHAGNFALALGLLGDERACPALRSMVTDPPAPMERVHPLMLRAVCLLGRLGQREDALLLMDVLEDEARTCAGQLVPTEKYRTGDELRYALLSQALMSLGRIASRHPSLRGEIGPAVRSWAMKERMIMAGFHPHDCAPVLKQTAFRLFDETLSTN